MAFKDEVGNKYNKLTAVERTPNNSAGSAMFKWLCDCGKYTVVLATCVRSGHTKSCGCSSKDRVGASGNRSRTKQYANFTQMKQRCTNPKAKNYAIYGGRGITVCNRWLEAAPDGFLNFLEDMGEMPEDMSLDRINVNGNYEPSNCRWATNSTQAFNTRRKCTNTSGRTGVVWRAKRNKWLSRINIDKRDICLGYYESFEDACAARAAAEIKYYGTTKE